MSAAIDILNPQKRIAIVASNPAVSEQTGWPIGFWWSELAHPYWDFVETGYSVDIYSPDGGALQADAWSHPRDESKYSSHDLISLGFLSSPEHSKLVEATKPISQLQVADYDAILFVGGQAPMYTFYNDARVADSTLQLLEDDQRRFWISSFRGIFRVSRDDLNALADGATTKVESVAYGTEDGMKSSACGGLPSNRK